MRDAETAARRRPLARVRATVLVAVALVLCAFGPAARPADASTTWSRNLYVSNAFLYQDPYYTACTAASAMHMLNTIAYRHTGGDDFAWRPTGSRTGQLEHAGHDVDPRVLASLRHAPQHLGGHRRAWLAQRAELLRLGQGRDDRREPARLRRPGLHHVRVGDEGRRPGDRQVRDAGGGPRRAGGHAQVITGYVVTGKDPRKSSDFTIHWIYLSDPLDESNIRNRRTSYAAMRDGALKFRFQWYRETDMTGRRPVHIRLEAELRQAVRRAVRVVSPLGDHPADPRGAPARP